MERSSSSIAARVRDLGSCLTDSFNNVCKNRGGSVTFLGIVCGFYVMLQVQRLNQSKYNFIVVYIFTIIDLFLFLKHQKYYQITFFSFFPIYFY